MIHGNFFSLWLSWLDNIPVLRIVHYSKVPHCPGVLQTQAANSVVRSMSCPLLANQMDKSVQFHFQALLAACRALLIGLWCGSACQVVCLNLHRKRLQDLQQEVSQYQIPATRARARCVSLWLEIRNCHYFCRCVTVCGMLHVISYTGSIVMSCEFRSAKAS